MVVRKRKMRREALIAAGIFEDYHACTLANYRGPKIMRDRVRKYIDHLPKMFRTGLSFLMFGENNAGKTTLAMILAKAFLINDYSVCVTNLRELTDKFCRGWEDEDEKVDFDNRIKNSDFLVIDDLNKEFQNRMTASVLDTVLRHRSNRRLPFIITTNSLLDELENEYGRSIIALLERRCVMLEFKSQLKNAETLVNRNLAILDALDSSK